jgi:hypothetical protein
MSALQLYVKKYKSDENKYCVCHICKEVSVSSLLCLKCKHAVCSECLVQMYTEECPICRIKLDGPLIKPNVINAIRSNQTKYNILSSERDQAAALYLQLYQHHVNTQDLYTAISYLDNPFDIFEYNPYNLSNIFK